MEEENGTKEPVGEEQPYLAGKFKSVDALVRAYEGLEAEFTRRSQRLKALEEEGKKGEAHHAQDADELYRAASENEAVRARILGDYVLSLQTPPLAGAGMGVPAPKDTPKTIREAGAFALGYLKKTNG